MVKEVEQQDVDGTVNTNIMKSRGLGDTIEKFTKATDFTKKNWNKGISIQLHDGAKAFFKNK